MSALSLNSSHDLFVTENQAYPRVHQCLCGSIISHRSFFISIIATPSELLPSRPYSSKHSKPPAYQSCSWNMDYIIEEAYRSNDRKTYQIAMMIRKLDIDYQQRRKELLMSLRELTGRTIPPPLDFSHIVNIIEAAPDEEAQLEAVMVRLSKRGEYDHLTAELAISTVGPHDTDAIVDFLETLAVEKIEHTTTTSGEKLLQCAACEDWLSAKDVVLVSCGHCYCGSCINNMFDAAATDESCYPPRCCKATKIPVKHAKRFLDADLKTKFDAKTVEFETVDRTYCSNPKCSIFIPPAEIDENDEIDARCLSCWSYTCVTCKAPGHGGDCPADLGLAELVNYAEENHWQRCYNCFRIIQKDDGCDHIT